MSEDIEKIRAKFLEQRQKDIDAELSGEKIEEADQDDFDRDAAFAYLESKGLKPAKNMGNPKLKALFEETKAKDVE
jgi:hypothetical protein